MYRIQLVATHPSDIDYTQYCIALASIGAPELQVAGIVGDLRDKLSPVLNEISKKFKVGLLDLVSAFQDTSLFAFLKAVGFNLVKVLEALSKASQVLRSGVDKVFRAIAESGMIEQLRKGTLKVDEVLAKYPILKKLSGPVLAGVLLYIWLSMTFIGNADFDFDLTHIAEAFQGRFNLTDLFTSPAGLSMLALFFTGAVFGVSFPWLGSSIPNLVIAILYTQYKQTGRPKFAAKLKSVIKKA